MLVKEFVYFAIAKFVDTNYYDQLGLTINASSLVSDMLRLELKSF